ncbi:VanW family protein [Paenibacillus glacialis]|uniref:G5 domain-containing protein n=1 Tax=Paenibacillus glacialis TaxID=494026 RepID=A0A168L779_9BACL|nr:VanW family protein [Paenibacillus glacialis]OAB42971.1 hypothetical protein PGLA_10980 [Paenibacillus glacialis]
MKKNHITLIISTALVTGSVLVGLCHLYVNQNTIPKGVQISGWSVGGMTTEAVLKDLNDKFQQLGQTSLHISAKNQDIPDMEWSLTEAGVRYEADAFQSAIMKLNKGNLLERVSYRWHFERSFDIKPHWNSSPMKLKFNMAWEKKNFGVPINATRRITSNDQVVYTPEVSAFQLDWETLTNRMVSLIPQNFYRLEHPSLTPLKIQLPFIIANPELSVIDLKKEGINRKIMEFSTSLDSSSEGRLYNVNSAAQATDGLLLKPGDVFDYGKIVALAEDKYGFQEAPVILNGKLVPGIGGGICQVSSTLYNAAIRTGMDIVERRNHSLPVRYLPKGQDATYATGSINFRFRNNTGKHLLIHVAVQGKTLTVKFFGTFPTDVTYDIESITVGTLTPPNKYVQNSTLPVGGQEIIQNGKAGYIIDTYQIKKVDGIVKERKRISHDTYLPQKTLIGIHPENKMDKDQPIVPKEKTIIEDGVSGPNF